MSSSSEELLIESVRVWQTIPHKIAKLQGAGALSSALERLNYRILPKEIGELMLLKILEPKPYQVSQIELVRIPAGELLTNRSTYEELCQEAVRRGLRHCASHIGPMLRLVYENQPPEEYLRVAMQPLYVDGYQYIFGVDCDLQGPVLSCNLIKPNTVYDLNFMFVFQLPDE